MNRVVWGGQSCVGWTELCGGEQSCVGWTELCGVNRKIVDLFLYFLCLFVCGLGLFF